METPDSLIPEEEFADSPLLRETARRLNFIFRRAAKTRAKKPLRFLKALTDGLALPRRISRNRVEHRN